MSITLPKSRTTTLVRLALAVVALHVADDNYLQPQPGTAASDHLASGLIPLALPGLAAWAFPRLSGAGRGALALASGLLAIAAGSEASTTHARSVLRATTTPACSACRRASCCSASAP